VSTDEKLEELRKYGALWPVDPADKDNYWSSSEYSGTFSVINGAQVEDVTPERVARVDASWVVEGDYSETNIAALVELTDGSWAAVMAWCDTTGWDCQSDVQWKWGPTRDLVISQGLDRPSRERLGLALPGEEVSS
jgi:hypothetical protein